MSAFLYFVSGAAVPDCTRSEQVVVGIVHETDCVAQHVGVAATLAVDIAAEFAAAHPGQIAAGRHALIYVTNTRHG